jgi:tetratricopeptide (TPR) repeat protein
VSAIVWAQMAGRLLAVANRHAHDGVDSVRGAFRPGPKLSAAEQYAQQGKGQLDKGQFGAALSSFDKALASDSTLVQAWVGRATAAMALEQFEDAAACAHQITVLDPHHSEGFGMLYGALLSMKRHDEALSACRLASSLDPHNRVWLAGIGFCLVCLDRPEEALAAFKMALKTDDTYSTALIGQANALNMLGREKKALNSVQRVLSKQPYLIYALQTESVALAQMQQMHKARTSLGKAMALLIGSHPNSNEGKKVSGFSLVSQKRIDVELAEMTDLYRVYDVLPEVFALSSVRYVRIGDAFLRIFLTDDDVEVRKQIKSILSQYSKYYLKFEVFRPRRGWIRIPALTVDMRSGTVSKLIAVVAAILILVGFIGRAMENRTAHTAQSPSSQSSNSIRSIPVPQPALDDDSAITAAIERKGYVVDGSIADIDGIAGGPKLHVARTRCISNGVDCDTKLYVFSGTKAVWSESISPSEFNYPIGSNGPGTFSIGIMERSVDSYDAVVATYTWNGSSLTKHEVEDDFWYCGNHGCAGESTSEHTASESRPQSQTAE